MNLIKSLNIKVVNSNLPDFYHMQGWEIPSAIDDTIDVPSNFEKVAAIRFRDLLEMPHIGGWACLGMCIDMLLCIDECENVDEIVRGTKNVLSCTKPVGYWDDFTKLSLYSALEKHAIFRNRPDDAMNYFNEQLRIYDEEDKRKDILYYPNPNSGKAHKTGMLNRSTTHNHIGQLLLVSEKFYSKKKDEPKTTQTFPKVIW